MAAGTGPERQRNHLDELPHTLPHTGSFAARARARARSGVAGTRGVCHPKIAGRQRFTTGPGILLASKRDEGGARARARHGWRA